MMGWLGFLAIVPWVQAFIWAFKPTQIIDIRRYPEAESAAINEEIARLKGESKPDESTKSAELQHKTTSPPAGFRRDL